jgi:hypothetical protein
MSYCIDSLSDLHKDARGFRPTQAFLSFFESSSEEDREEIWSSLIEEVIDQNDQYVLDQTHAIIAFEMAGENYDYREEYIADVIKKADGDDGYAEYLAGIPYGYLAREV